MPNDVEKKLERLRGLSLKIDELFDLGNISEGEELLKKAIEESVEFKAYQLFFQGEAASYLEKDYSKQEDYFRKAVEIRQKDYFLLRNMGTCLSLQDREEEAIEWFSKAVNENPKDFNSLRAWGVSLTCLGRRVEAIEMYDKALKENHKDWKSMNQRGVCLTNLGSKDEAIVWFDQAIKENPNSYSAYREWAITEYNSKNYDVALDKIKKAFELAPNKKSIMQDLEFLAKIAGKDVKEIIAEFVKNKEITLTDVGSVLASFTLRVQELFKPRIKEFADKMAETETRRKEFLSPNSNMRNDLSFLLVLRKWNSFTPAIPSGNEERSVGGGYYIRHNDKGIVIDPGYNFIENFANAGGKITDIDNIIITHAHNDHTNDFESLMSLLYQYND